jgi:hypothetical protein
MQENSAVDYMLHSLSQWSKEPVKTISKKDYNLFCNEYVFLKLKGRSFGEAFCEKFDIQHFIIQSLPNDSAKGYIERHGYVK